MSSFIQAICCCLFPEQPRNNSHTNNQKKTKKQKRLPKPSRIITKYPKQSIKPMSKSQKLQGIPVYTCPICTCYINKILACSGCENTICRKCVRQYEKKYLLSKQDMRCPFCNSEVSVFRDYQKEPKRYFDTTGNKKAQLRKSSALDGIDSTYREKGEDKENQTRDEMRREQEEEETSNIPTERNDLPLKQIRVLNAMMKNHKEKQFKDRVSQEISQLGMLNPNREDNPESTDLSFIEQFQLRTVEDISD